MKTTIWISALLPLVLSSMVYAASDEQELETLLNAFMAGASANSAEAHDRFWADELVYTSSSGERFGKAEIMSGFDDVSEPDAEEETTIYTAEDVHIQIYDDAAVVTFRLLGTAQTGVTEYFNTGTFLRRDGQWAAVAWQATKIPAND